MSKNLTQEVSIWGTNNCEQCGACCFDIPGCTEDLCFKQEIKEGKSYCKLHGPQKPSGCRDYDCIGARPEVAEELRQTAIGLGTVPIFYRAPTPQENPQK